MSVRDDGEQEYHIHGGHLAAFGAIIHTFARHETMIVGCISHLLDCEGGRVMHLTAEMPYRAKRDALKALLTVLTIPADQVERIGWFLGEMHKHNDLRNAIAHNIWSKGARPGSIKPLSLGVRGGKTAIKGISVDDPDYTESELKGVANDLLKTHEAFKRYLLSIDYLPMRTG